MEFTTKVDIPTPSFSIEPQERMLFVGSCFADNIGRRFADEMFLATVNPLGVMYNPASILHTIECVKDAPRVAVLTLGTNHVYRLKETGEIVDNCRKRPAKLFQEEELTVDECQDYLQRAVDILLQRNKDVQVVITVSPIRYAKYGFHGSQLSKATLLLAADKVVRANSNCTYFPAYEIVNDELRDYRFYREDMLHPSDQTVEYIWQQLKEKYLSKEAKTFIEKWKPVKEAIRHRPFNANSPEYLAFVAKTKNTIAKLREEYPLLPLIPDEFGIFSGM